MPKKLKRSPNFIPVILAALKDNPSFTCKISELPMSYQLQPYNLANKVFERGGVKIRIVINREKDFFAAFKQICNLTNTNHAE